MSVYRLRPEPGRASGWHILTLAGVPFFVQPSFLIFAGLIMLMYIQNGATLPQAGLLGFIIFFSLLGHEAGHALMARVLGYRDLSVSLVAMGGETHHPPATRGHSLLIVLAGPAVTVGLVLGAWLAYRFFPALFEQQAAAFFVLVNVLWLNTFWAIFNLLPIYPLDGGQSLFYLLSFATAEQRALAATAYISLGVCALLFALMLFKVDVGFYRFNLGDSPFLAFFVCLFFVQNLQLARSLGGR